MLWKEISNLVGFFAENEVTKSSNVCVSAQLSRFTAEFGMSPYLCKIVWSYLKQKPNSDRFAKKNHLLWALS